MGATWILQTKLGTDGADLVRALESEGFPIEVVRVVPGSQVLPAMPEVNGPFVIYGRTTLILNALRSSLWRRGVFFDPSRFRPSAYAEGFGDRMLNADARFDIAGEFVTRLTRAVEAGEIDFEHRMFVRPDDDFKHFTGGVMAVREILELDSSLSIVTAPVREIDAEYRLFVVDGRVVTGSMYRPNADPWLPPELVAFGEESVRVWAPAPVFALDVARCGSEYWIVECNCFNGCSFYAADLPLLVRAVSAYQSLTV